MPHSIEMYFDFVTDSVVRTAWESLLPLSQSNLTSGARPHLKLAIYDSLDVEEMKGALAAYAKSTPPMEIVFPSIGMFPSERSIVFLAPAMTDRLLNFQSGILEHFHDQQPWEYCMPARWVPHCLLVRDVPPHAIPNMIAKCQKLTLPLNGRLERIGLVEFPPAREICSFDLEGEE